MLLGVEFTATLRAILFSTSPPALSAPPSQYETLCRAAALSRFSWMANDRSRCSSSRPHKRSLKQPRARVCCSLFGKLRGACLNRSRGLVEDASQSCLHIQLAPTPNTPRNDFIRSFMARADVWRFGTHDKSFGAM